MASVVEIWRYPVKSMAGERLDSCAVGEVGLEGDRRWAFVDDSPNRAGKLFTIREDERLMTYAARLAGGHVEVVTSGGEVRDLDAQMVAELAVQAGMHLDHRRFRANLYVDGLAPEEEIGWVGRRVRAGDAELEVVSRCERCVVITRDPETTSTTPELLRLLTETRETCMGVYCRVAQPGRVATGDAVGVV